MRNQGRIIDLENGAIRGYKPDFFKSILIKSAIKDKNQSYSDDVYYKKKISNEEILKPHSNFTQKDFEEVGDDEVFDDIDESENPDRILPYIYQKTINSVVKYLPKAGGKNEYNVKEMIDFCCDSEEPFAKISKNFDNNEISYAIFSQDNGHPFKNVVDEKSQPSVQCEDLSDKSKCPIFYQPFVQWKDFNSISKSQGTRYIQKARDKIFALFTYYHIPIVIKVTGTKINPKYFINAWKSPFIRYPELSRTIFNDSNNNDDNATIYYTTFNNLYEKNENESNQGDEESRPNKKGSKPNKKGSKRNKEESQQYRTETSVSLKYVSLPEVDTVISNKRKVRFLLPKIIVQKSIPTYPDYSQYSEELKTNSLLPVYYRFSKKIERIISEENIKTDDSKETLTDYKNVVSYLELGYTPMNVGLPKMNTNINIDNKINFLSFLNQERNVSSIMEIASNNSSSLFLPLEPGGVQLLVGDEKLWHLAYYSRNKNSVMANANAIAAGLRTSNIVVVPITPSHVSHFLESLDCAFTNWKRFGLAKYNMCYNQPSSKFKMEKPTIVFYFEPCQRPFDVEIAKKNIEFHCYKYEDIFFVKFAESQHILTKIIDVLRGNANNENYNISKIELLYSIAAFATVNDCADFLELNDTYEAKSSFAFNEFHD